MEIITANSFQQIHLAMTECAVDLYNQSLNNTSDLKRLSEKYVNGGGVVQIAKHADEIAGLIAYYRNNFKTKCAYISMLVCKKEFWGMGIAAALFNKMLEDCQRYDFKKIRLEVEKNNFRAINFYKRRGFKIECSATEKSDYYQIAL